MRTLVSILGKFLCVVLHSHGLYAPFQALSMHSLRCLQSAPPCMAEEESRVGVAPPQPSTAEPGRPATCFSVALWMDPQRVVLIGYSAPTLNPCAGNLLKSLKNMPRFQVTEGRVFFHGILHMRPFAHGSFKHKPAIMASLVMGIFELYIDCTAPEKRNRLSLFFCCLVDLRDAVFVGKEYIFPK